MEAAFAILLITSLVGSQICSMWIYWTKMWPLMESRGAIPRKPLWGPIWPYKRICQAENLTLKYWDYFWLSTWISLLSFALLGLMGFLSH